MNQLNLTLEPPKARRSDPSTSHAAAKAAKRRKPPKVREIRIEGDVAYVPLTKGLEAVIDAEDVHLFSPFNWFAIEQSHTSYAARHTPRPNRVFIRMHMVLTPVPDGFQVDHIDGNGLNNRRSNLRVATVAENAHNRKKPANNSSGFKGVHWRKSECKWVARIMVRGVRMNLGHFDDPKSAHDAYCEASKHLHGEFGRIA